MATSGSTSSPYLFAATSGYRSDNDDGLMLVGARYYDPAVGLFITRDTDLSQPAYQYCNDDPINAVDPSGHMYIQPISILNPITISFLEDMWQAGMSDIANGSIPYIPDYGDNHNAGGGEAGDPDGDPWLAPGNGNQFTGPTNNDGIIDSGGTEPGQVDNNNNPENVLGKAEDGQDDLEMFWVFEEFQLGI